jgi:hypothetical protein
MGSQNGAREGDESSKGTHIATQKDDIRYTNERTNTEKIKKRLLYKKERAALESLRLYANVKIEQT